MANLLFSLQIQNCNQDYVNMCVGAWWALSLLVSLFTVSQLEPQSPWPDDEEPLLEEDHASPVGFKVPNLPDFPIDPELAKRGVTCCSIKAELLLGSVMAVALGLGICYLSFTDQDENFASSLMGES